MSGWIGVDLDATLAYYDGWKSPEHIGEPIPKMAERVKNWLSEGREVRIFTARVSSSYPKGHPRYRDVEKVRADIQDWTEKHFGVRLIVTNEKDFGMVELWDDRCVQVQPNTGELVQDFWRHTL